MSTANLNVTVESLKSEFTSFVDNVQKFAEKGNKSAAVRARKNLLAIGKLVKEGRKQIQEARGTSTTDSDESEE